MSEPAVEHSMEAEHGVQFTLFNALRDAIDSSQSSEVVGRLVDQVIDYTNVHFLSEQLMMRMYNYPDYALHEDEHDLFMEEMNVLRESCSKGDTSEMSQKIGDMLKWLRDHVDGMDRALNRFLREQSN